MGGDEDDEDLVVEERRASRIFFTLESLVPFDDGQVLLLFKLNRNNSIEKLRHDLSFSTDSVLWNYLLLMFVVA